MDGGWTTAPPLPNAPTNLASMCSYDQLKIDSNPCMSACWPAKQAGCGGPYGPSNCANYYPCQNLENGPATTSAPGSVGGPPQAPWTTAPPLPNPPTNLASMCSYDQLKIDSNPCMSACWPAKQAGCGGPYGPSNCANYY